MPFLLNCDCCKTTFIVIATNIPIDYFFYYCLIGNFKSVAIFCIWQRLESLLSNMIFAKVGKFLSSTGKILSTIMHGKNQSSTIFRAYNKPLLSLEENGIKFALVKNQ